MSRTKRHRVTVSKRITRCCRRGCPQTAGTRRPLRSGILIGSANCGMVCKYLRGNALHSSYLAYNIIIRSPFFVNHMHACMRSAILLFSFESPPSFPLFLQDLGVIIVCLTSAHLYYNNSRSSSFAFSPTCVSITHRARSAD